MRWNRPTKTTFALLTALLMGAMALAGCMAEGDQMSFDSYEEAKSASGETVGPDNESEGDRIMLKLLHPQDSESAEEGKQPFIILLYDAEADTPVTDAMVEIESRMPAMGHGTDEEEDPTHQNHGVYQGQINLLMPGDWVTHVDVTPADGVQHSFEVEFRV